MNVDANEECRRDHDGSLQKKYWTCPYYPAYPEATCFQNENLNDKQ
jgi:hypothetical protein